MEIFGFFHFFETVEAFVEAENALIDNDIATGKYIILKGQISTKDGTMIGKKDGIMFMFTSIFRDEKKYNQLIKDGKINGENQIPTNKINRDEFDEYNNLKKAITFDDYKEFIAYTKENTLK